MRTILMSLLLISCTHGAQTLATARSVAKERYDGWTYGGDPAKKQIDCVQFVLAVVEAEMQQSLKPEIRNAILINYGWTAEKTQEIAGEGKDPRLGGVAHALTVVADTGAKVVAPADVAPGDIAQYWMKQADGTWFGHSGVVEKRDKDRIWLFGSHRAKNGIGTAPDVGLDLKGTDRMLYFVRLK